MPQPRGWQTRGRRPWRLAARSFCGIAALLTAGYPAAAQTLSEALAYAYRNNPQLLAQRASLRATDEEVPQALSGWRPTVTVNTQAGFNRAGRAPDRVLTGNETTQYHSFVSRSMALQATQPIYRGGRTEAADQAGDQHRAGRPRADLFGRDAMSSPLSSPPISTSCATRTCSRSPATTSRSCASSWKRRATGSGSAR